MRQFCVKFISRCLWPTLKSWQSAMVALAKPACWLRTWPASFQRLTSLLFLITILVDILWMARLCLRRSVILQEGYDFYLGPFYSHSLTAWISNYIHHKVLDEIIYPSLNFNVFTVKVWEQIRYFVPYLGLNCLSIPRLQRYSHNFTPRFIMIVIIHAGIKVNPRL